MKPSFSELSFAYALTETLVSFVGMPLLSAPSFPSTSAEGKKGGGYDLKLPYHGMSLFLQFKLSDCMSNASAREFTSGKFSQVVGGAKSPVYRMYLHPLARSRQTSLMLKLEKRHNFVYYVAPLFHLPSELSKYYFAKDVAQNCRFIRPSVIKKMPDQAEHFVSFRSTGKSYRFSNDPIELRPAETVEEVIAHLKNNNRQMSVNEAIEQSLEAMLGALGDDVAEWPEDLRQQQRQEIAELRQLDFSPLVKAEFIARTYFGLQLFLFSDDQREGEAQSPEGTVLLSQTSQSIFDAISRYARAYKKIEVVQRANPVLLPRGDQKTGVIAEFYGRLYAAERFAPVSPEFGSTSEHAWDIKIPQPNGESIKIQIKAVSAHAEKGRISPIHSGWDELWLMRLTEEMVPEAFWIYKKSDSQWALTSQKSKTMPQRGKPGTGSVELRNGEDKLVELLDVIARAKRAAEKDQSR